MNDLALEQLLDGLAVLIARKRRGEWALWLFYLVEKIKREQPPIPNNQRGAKATDWIQALQGDLLDLRYEMEDPL